MLLTRLRSVGIDPHLGVFTERQTLVPDLEANGIVVHDLSTATSAVGRARKVWSLLRTVPFDVVHATLHDATIPAQLATATAGVPVLVTWATTNYGKHSPGGHEGHEWKLRIVQTGEAVLARAADTSFHGVTTGVARVNASHLHVSSDRVAVGERGRDAGDLAVTPDEIAQIREDLGLTGARIVLAVGRQDPEKGYRRLLDAFDEVADAILTSHLVIAGRAGHDSEELARRRLRLRHPERVHLLGHRSDVRVLLAAAEVIVCSSFREGAAGALVEAMAAGTPIVTVPLKGLEDVVVDGRNGSVVPPEHLAEGILRLLGDESFAASLADQARREFVNRFTIDRAAGRMAEIYRWAAARREA